MLQSLLLLYLTKISSSIDAASTHSVPSIECKAKHVITITDPPCPEPSTESAKSTSCICPPRSLIIERVATSSSILLTSPSLPVISGLLPVKGIANVDDANNTVADKCAQGIDKHLTGMFYGLTFCNDVKCVTKIIFYLSLWLVSPLSHLQSLFLDNICGMFYGLTFCNDLKYVIKITF